MELDSEISHKNQEIYIPEAMEVETGDTEIKNPKANAESSNEEAEVKNTEVENGPTSEFQGEERQPEAGDREDDGSDGRADNMQDQIQERENTIERSEDNDGVIIVEEESNQNNQGEVIELGDEEVEEETMDPSEISENIYTALQAIEDNGTFATSGTFTSAPNPVLSIDGIGIVGLPLSSRDAEAIVTAAAQAPFGHGEKTVVDTNVRDTWELQPNQVQFLNPAWKEWIEKEILVKAADDLGILDAAQTVKCELYKALLYKEGGHFLPHKE